MKISLQKQLEQAKLEKANWESKYWDVREKLDKLEEKERFTFKGTLTNYESQIREMVGFSQQMMEIVRWHVNPETAKMTKVCQQCGLEFGKCVHIN